MADHRLDTLAAIAHFSPFHFHRIYQAVTGETVAATIRRVRLAHATLLLDRGRQSIARVALQVGYESPQAFTRAFRQFTGESPRGFQRKMLLPARRLAAVRSACEGDTDPAVRIVERPALRVHALRHHGPPATIPHTHRRLHSQVDECSASQWLGISYRDPGAGVGGFRYYAAAVLQGSAPTDAEIVTFELPAARYALHRLAGPYSQINAALGALYARWLPRSGYERDDGPTLECYLNSPRTNAAQALRTDLLIPVRPLA